VPDTADVRSPAESAVPDVLAPDLAAVFCGINPGRASSAAGAHFANPRNDFWRLLHAAGFTPGLLEPSQQHELLRFGFGLTNAAFRTTRGSSELRRGDFAGAAERLERLATDLRPGAIGFVGKAAYQGVFGERAVHGPQERRLADTRLFVLPSTSPANAAVPWEERLRWFRVFRGSLKTGVVLRQATRAIVRDPDDRVLLVRFEFPDRAIWATPGGGIEEGESHEHAIRRELEEETGLVGFELGPPVWLREHVFPLGRWDGQAETYYLVRTPAFEPEPRLSWEQLNAEYVTAMRWWTLDQLESSAERFSPRGLPRLLRRLLEDGPPQAPIDVGV
jgi:double-stranded uracil-DNA glycosylase